MIYYVSLELFSTVLQHQKLINYKSVSFLSQQIYVCLSNLSEAHKLMQKKQKKQMQERHNYI